MKPYIRLPHSRKFLELEKLVRKTKPNEVQQARAAALIKWLMKRRCNYWIWCMKESLGIDRPRKTHLDTVEINKGRKNEPTKLTNQNTKWWPK